MVGGGGGGVWGVKKWLKIRKMIWAGIPASDRLDRHWKVTHSLLDLPAGQGEGWGEEKIQGLKEATKSMKQSGSTFPSLRRNLDGFELLKSGDPSGRWPKYRPKSSSP